MPSRRRRRTTATAINELWARIAVAHVLLEVDPAACRDTLVAMAAASREMPYSAGIVAALQGLATAAILLDDDATAAAALDDLLDSFVHGELVGDLRSALRMVAVLMHQRRGRSLGGHGRRGVPAARWSARSPRSAPSSCRCRTRDRHR